MGAAERYDSRSAVPEVLVFGGREMMKALTVILRALRMRDATKRCPVYELDGAAGVTLWLTQARRIGASMDRLARALR